LLSMLVALQFGREIRLLPRWRSSFPVGRDRLNTAQTLTSAAIAPRLHTDTWMQSARHHVATLKQRQFQSICAKDGRICEGKFFGGVSLARR
jgi:hypothetical protein